MRYFGGKARIGGQISKIINDRLSGSYWEPFCGMFSVGKHVTLEKRAASDLHPDLILLLNAVRDGWRPPTEVSEAEYNSLKTAPSSPLRAFVGFGCSNSGKFFGGYARESTGRNFAANAANSLEKLRPLIQGVEFFCDSYDLADVDANVIYCDPPYKGTTGFTVGGFDTEAFWEWVRYRSLDATVLVSEYDAPDDFVPIWCKEVRTDMNDGKRRKLQRVEKMFLSEHLFID